MKQFDLAWGNAVAIRHAFLEGIPKTIFFKMSDENLRYTPHNGDPTLIEITRKVLERQIGRTYKHIFLTNGATGGVTIALRAYEQKGHKTVYTRKPPFFPVYPAMIQAAGMQHFYDMPTTQKVLSQQNPVTLLDSPANPTGAINENIWTPTPVIWDAVYYSKVYISGFYHPPTHDLIVGSYSKLLGLNGLRTGWIATNDDALALRLAALVEAEYCGLSSASNVILLQVLKDYRSKTFWENFEYRAKNALNDNRGEWSKLEKFFGNQPICQDGMFYYAPVDGACHRLLTKSGITWTPGSKLWASDSHGRFNLGQDRKLVKEAVKEILKNDRR